MIFRPSIPSPPQPQSRNSLLPYHHLCYPNALFTVIQNLTNGEIVLYRINLHVCGYRGPLWPTRPLNIIIIIKYNHSCVAKMFGLDKGHYKGPY